jgi:phosphate transport system protein
MRYLFYYIVTLIYRWRKVTHMFKRFVKILQRLDINFLKVVVGVIFSLIWGQVMYFIWGNPSFIVFIWFYLGIGSVVLKWVIFYIIDRIHTRFRVQAVKKELAQSTARVEQFGPTRLGKPEAGHADISVTESIAEELNQLERGILELGASVQNAMDMSIESLKTRNEGIARQVIENDAAIDQKTVTVRDNCLELIVHYHPEGMDLRRIIASLGISIELERMGDYAEGISNISLMIGAQPLIKPLVDVPLMEEISKRMLSGSLDAFVEKNVEKAAHFSKMDDEVDGLYEQIFRELIVIMIENPGKITQAIRLVWAAHDLERYADRVTNICEMVIFAVTGK